MKKDFKRIKERLYNYTRLKSEKIELEIRLEESREQIGLKSVSYEDIGNSYSISRTTENQALKVVSAREDLERFIIIRDREIKRIENAMEGLTTIERDLIKNKYFHRRRNDSMPGILDRSERQCSRIETKALTLIYNILEFENVCKMTCKVS